MSDPFSHDDILKHLPHRPPMLFLHHIVAQEGQSVVAESHIDPDLPMLAGHFPGRPIMPGVLIAETIAQAGAFLVSVTDSIPEGQFLAFAQMDNVKFRRPVYPNDTMIVEVEIVKARRSLYKFSGSASVDGQIVTSMDFTAALMPFDQD